MKKILLIANIAILILVCSFINVSCAQKEGLETGNKAPDFSLEDVSSNKVSLQETAKANNATLLVFWATWCPYCRQEVPELIKLNSEYKDKGLKILAIDLGESQKKVESFVKQEGISYTVLLDTDNKVASQYGIMGIPNNILLGKDGVIKYRGTRPPPENLLPKK